MLKTLSKIRSFYLMSDLVSSLPTNTVIKFQCSCCRIIWQHQTGNASNAHNQDGFKRIYRICTGYLTFNVTSSQLKKDLQTQYISPVPRRVCVCFCRYSSAYKVWKVFAYVKWWGKCLKRCIVKSCFLTWI